MAEAAVELPVGQFYCHKCLQEISPLLPDYICPRCQSGFIEQLEHQNSPQESPNDDLEDNMPAGFPEHIFPYMEVLQPFLMSGGSSRENEDGPSSLAPSGGPSSQNAARRARPEVPHRVYPTRSMVRRRLSSTDRNVVPLEGFLHQIIANLTGTGGGLRGNAGIPVFFNLHGNPGDYVWGRGGLDAVITQLLNQFDGTGPPPLPKEKIKDIPSVNITQEQVSKILQCTVCMEDFKLNEPVKRLLCSHHFHQGCIIPWLELHGTCPICRKILNEEENGRNSSEGSSGSSNRVRQDGSSTSSHPPNSVFDFDDDYE